MRTSLLGCQAQQLPQFFSMNSCRPQGGPQRNGVHGVGRTCTMQCTTSLIRPPEHPQALMEGGMLRIRQMVGHAFAVRNASCHFPRAKRGHLVEMVSGRTRHGFQLAIWPIRIMRPEPSPAGGSLDEVCMVLRDAAVVNRGQFGCGRDGLDGPKLAVVAAKVVARPQFRHGRPALALDPERMLGRGAAYSGGLRHPARPAGVKHERHATFTSASSSAPASSSPQERNETDSR